MTCRTLLPHMQSRDLWCLCCFPFSKAAISCSVSVCRASRVDQGVTTAAVECCGRNVDPLLLRISFLPLAPGCLEGKPASYAVSVALSCSSFLQGSCHGIPAGNAAGVLLFPGMCKWPWMHVTWGNIGDACWQGTVGLGEGWAPEITWKAQLVPSAGLAVTGSGAAYWVCACCSFQLFWFKCETETVSTSEL